MGPRVCEHFNWLLAPTLATSVNAKQLLNYIQATIKRLTER